MSKDNELIIHRQYLALLIVMFFTLILCIPLSAIINTDIIALFIFILFTLVFVRKNFYTVPKYIAVYVYTIIFLIGVFICENFNFYLRELDVYSGHYGSFPLAILYSLILISSLSYYDKKISKRMTYNYENIKSKFAIFIAKFIYVFVFAAGMILFLSVATKPSFKFGIDRFQYEQFYLNKYIKFFASYYKYLLPFTILPFILKEKKPKTEIIKILITLSPYILFKVWVGNKFGAIFDILILFFPIIIFYIGNVKKNKNVKTKRDLIIITKASENRKLFKSIGIAFVFLVFILSVFYISRGKDASSSIIDRLSQQGQLWWKIYSNEEIKGQHIYELNDELKPLIEYKKMDISDYNFGVYKIMRKTTPINIYRAKIATGARYSSQGIDIAYYYFGYVGIIIHAVIRAFFTVLIINTYIKCFFSGRFIETIIMGRILIISNSIFTQGDLFNLTKPEFLIMIAILIIMKLLHKKYSPTFTHEVKSYEK